MTKESDILKIVKEDLLRILSEEKSKKTSLKFIKGKVKVSNLFIHKAIKELKEQDLIQLEGNFISLTKEGKENAKNILKKHLVLENYFKKTRSEREAHKAAELLEHQVSKEVIDNIKKLATLKEKDIPLLEFKLNEATLITDITLKSKLFERIISMGIFPGEKIRVLNKVSNGIIVKIENKKFALDNSIAKEIKVLLKNERT